MSATPSQRGRHWLAQLTGNQAPLPGYARSVQVVDTDWAGRPIRFLAIVPDADNPYPRVRQGEVGLVEAWQLAQAVQQLRQADRDNALKTPIVALIDVPSQAYGRTEEAYGLHQAIAGAAGAYAQARLDGHAVIGLIVGKAISGAFLAHGYQANRLIALNDDEVQVHAMGKASAARITLRSVEALDALADKVPPMAYDIQRYTSLGLLWRTLNITNADQPTPADLDLVRQHLQAALADIEATGDTRMSQGERSLQPDMAQSVRAAMRQQWTQR